MGRSSDTLPSIAPGEVTPTLYRRVAGYETDLLIDCGGSRGLWAIDIKLGSVAKTSKGFAHVLEEVEHVVYSEEERYPKSKDVEVVGVKELCLEVASA